MKTSVWERAFGRLLPLHLFTLLCLTVVEPNDLWRHLLYARITLAEHAFPDIDRLSFVTEGTRFVDQPWLAEWTLYGAYKVGGLAAVIVVHALAVAAGYAFVWSFARKRMRPANAAVATIIAAAIGGAHWGVRPQSFSFLLFGLLVRILDEHAAGRKRALWLGVPVFAIWANVHGIYTVGWLAVGVHVGVRVLEALKKEGLAGVRAQSGDMLAAIACVLAGAVNPHGVRGLVEHVLQFVEKGHGIVGGAEFDAMSIRRLDGMVFVYGACRLAYAMMKTGYRPALARGAVLVVFGLFSMSVVRVEPWFGMLLLTPLGEALDREDDARATTQAPARPAVAAALVVASLVAAVAALPPFRERLPLPPSRRVLASVDTPFAATAALCARAHDRERVFADQGFASYVEWACPKARIFVDTRVTPFDESTWEEYGAVLAGRFDQSRILDHWKVDALMLRTDQTAALAALAAHGGWKETYRDAVGVVLARVDGPPGLGP